MMSLCSLLRLSITWFQRVIMCTYCACQLAMQMAWEVLEKKSSTWPLLFSRFQPGKYIFWTIRICRFFLNGLDGFGKVWDWNLLSSIIDKEMSAHSIDLIITFDEYGISGHCNHCDVHQGVRKLVHDTSGRHFEAWELVSTNIVRKYIGPVDIWLSILLGRCLKTGQSHCLLNLYPRRSYDAMAQHSSQWVWYRKLFVAFSSYTYVNTLKKIA
ncbi:probable N-acetylglucosaminyl-phosphatidylinositol de-N-acetylase isoform X3 [Sesamum indicum]|uniref:N-acetylglucosaminylphosphatidylinositol deacetylase n=1 Tax=Sesamum indicum TaxID=4182 RepID=A0A6I9SUV3_SESIN|nr:probable N-acetylglucosaminyl-phosphatidylinositol de-N-acetylase isoform X3 [Sesamum indicum]